MIAQIFLNDLSVCGVGARTCIIIEFTSYTVPQNSSRGKPVQIEIGKGALPRMMLCLKAIKRIGRLGRDSLAHVRGVVLPDWHYNESIITHTTSAKGFPMSHTADFLASSIINSFQSISDTRENHGKVG